MNYFPNGDEEIALLKFISKYQYLNVNDVKYFFKSQKYYRKRITNLVQKKYIRRTKSCLVLDELGIEYCKLFKFDYTILNRNKKYFPRLLYISNLAAFYHSSDKVQYVPSFAMKSKEVFTVTARKFIGVFNISGIEYLAYYISEKHDNKYLMSVIYDIQKENKYKNIIIFINDVNRITFSDFAFGNNKVLIIEDNEINREKLKFLNSINWSKAIQEIYKDKVYFSEYNFCDYTDYKNKYISYFYFLDTEKINRIKSFLRENKNKNADIICSIELKERICKELPTANFISIHLEDYIDKERIVYD